MKDFLKEISKMLDDALDSDKTDMEQSLDLLYAISGRLERKIEELESESE